MNPGWKSRLADLGLAEPARLADAAAAAERHGHPVADREAVHLGPDLHDLAAQLVAGHVRAARSTRRGPSSRASPMRQTPVASTAHHHAVRRAHGIVGTVSIDRGDANECMTAARIVPIVAGVLEPAARRAARARSLRVGPAGGPLGGPGRPAADRPDRSRRSTFPPCPDGRRTRSTASTSCSTRAPARPARRSPALLRPRSAARATRSACSADLIGTRPQHVRRQWTGGAGATALELAVIDWLRGWMGMPPETEGILVSGGSVATLTALAAAAHAKVDDRDQATGYVQEHTHAAVGKAWRILGFNPANLRGAAADPAHRLQPAAIDAAIHIDREAGLQPFVLVGTAGTTSTGSVDPLHDLADLAQREGLWFHVDGAYGAPARLTPQGEELLAGIERADSLVLDPHKWLFQPYEIGVRARPPPGTARADVHPRRRVPARHLRAACQMRERGPQLTRRSRALKLWLSLTDIRSRRIPGGDRPRDRARRARGGDAAHRRMGGHVACEPGRGHVPPARRRQRRHGARSDRRVASPRRARRSSTAAPWRGCARSTPARPSATSSARSSASKVEGGPTHRRPSPLPLGPLFQPGLDWSGPSGRSAGVALRGVREGCRPLGHADRKQARAS